MLKKTLKTSLLFLYIFFLAGFLVSPYICKVKTQFLLLILMFFIYIVVIEVLFRLSYRIIYKTSYLHLPKIPFDKIFVEPHPYLSYVYKKRFRYQREMPARFPLYRDGRYMLAELRTNNYRHLNGPTGDRDIKTPKPKGMVRINCLGGSTTANYIRYKGQNYSYPMELEKILQGALPNIKIEVNNCGQPAYTSAEILIKFLLDTIDTEPDIIVIYHAYNDLGPSLTANFQPDYSHARRNLGEVYYLYKLASKISDIQLASWHFLIKNCVLGNTIRPAIINQAISRRNADIKNDFNGLDTYKRNIEHIINICKMNRIYIILSTFSYYLYPEVQDNRVYLKYYEGVKLENKIMKDLAAKHNLPLIDNASLIPLEDRYFVDTVHFTPEGMQLVARNISLTIIEYIKNRKWQIYG